jgi:glycosyltransferase involved in cell wall biosynthesis
MDISIIICTHNPQERIFKRCLEAVQNLKRGSLNVEVLLIDNNSVPALNESDYIKHFLLQCTGTKYIRENKPGLTYARMAGFKNAIAPVFILFDDDNEPEESYLLGVNDFLLRVPQIGVFGPGIVAVDFIDGPGNWLEKKRKIFQEKAVTTEQWDQITDSYQECYPYGTGMVVKREVINYYELISSQNETSDRKENSLISGGDVQIVLSGIKAGYAAGCTPLLKINHLIPWQRTSDSYLRKLSYSTAYSYTKAYLGVFPEKEKKFLGKKISFIKFCFIFIKCVISSLVNNKRLFNNVIPALVGDVSGYYYAFNEKRPYWLLVTEKVFNLNYQM